MTNNIDFVIPLHRNNIIFRTTVEAIIQNYGPNKIYVITNYESICEIKNDFLNWKLHNTKITLLDEANFFVKNFNLNKYDIQSLYHWKDSQSREFGWWYQQILKMGAFQQIEGLSDPYMVWDSDLIVLDKWDILPSITVPFFQFAILQEQAKNSWNKTEYANSIHHLIQLDALEPKDEEGTFVPHHFIFHHHVLNDMFSQIEKIHDMNWIKCIINLSNNFYRFSEYKCIATFMNKFYPELLNFHSFKKYGKNGIRYRECEEIINNILSFCHVESYGLSYKEFQQFIKENYKDTPSYIQIEHVV